MFWQFLSIDLWQVGDVTMWGDDVKPLWNLLKNGTIGPSQIGLPLCWRRPLNKGVGLRHNLAGAFSSVLQKIPKRFDVIFSHCDIPNLSRMNTQGPSEHQSAWRLVLDKTWNVATQSSKSSWLVSIFNFLIIYLDEWQPS